MEPINPQAQQNNLPPLTISAALTRAAQWMADDMAANGNLNSHIDSAGRSYAARIGNCGYSSPATAVDIVLASSGSTPQTALSGWTSSASHNPVILNSVTGVSRNWQGIGVGKSDNGTTPFRQRWVVAFGEVNDGGIVPTITPTQAPTITQPAPTVTQVPTITSPTPSIAIPIITIIPATGSGSFAVSFKMPGIENKNNFIVDKKILGQVEVKSGNNLISKNWYQFTFNPQTSTYTQIPLTLGVGNYNVRVRSTNSLWKDLESVIISQNQSAPLPTTTLVAGDLNQDNVLNLADYTILLSCYDPRSCEGKLNSDLNKDGKVNYLDLNIFYAGLANRQGD